MKKRLLDRNEDGRSEYFYKEDDKIIIETVEDTDMIIKHAREMAKTYNDNSQEGLLATIPASIVELWNLELPNGRSCTEPEFKQFFRDKLNSPEYSKFRIKKGKI
jgi:hypothetical protein